MKAVITDGKGKIELADIDLPSYDEYDCLVKIEVCVFCNSTDRHLIEGTFPFEVNYPGILGHESIGVIERIGEKVKNFKPGDRVLRAFALYPEEELSGYKSCWGGFAEYGKIKDAQAMVDDGLLEKDNVPNNYKYTQKVPEDIDLEKSLLMISQKEICSSVAKFKQIEGQRFLIAGAGITGQLFGRLLKIKGAAQVTIAARRQEPLDLALEQQAADEVFLISGAKKLANDYDALVDTTGSLDVARELLHKAVKPNGTFYSYAVYDGMADETFFDEFKGNYTFMRVDPAEPEAHEAVIELLRENKLAVAPYISFRFKIDDIQDAWSTIVNKQAIKTAVYF